MAVNPLVRYMIPCEERRVDPNNPRNIDILGVISNIRSHEFPPYPLYQDFSVFLALTDGRGAGDGQIVCVSEETGQKVFESPKRQIAFTADPLEVIGVRFRIVRCLFPSPGMYLLQFWYNDERLDERPLRLR